MSENPFATKKSEPNEPEVIKVEVPEVEVETVESLLTKAEKLAKSTVAKQLINDSKILWSKLQENLEDEEWLRKKFTAAMDLKLRAAISNERRAKQAKTKGEARQ